MWSGSNDRRALAESIRGPLLTAEEVLHCLSDPEVRVLVNTVVAQLSGGQMIFDICNAMIMKRAGATVEGHGRIPQMDPGGF